MKAHRGVVSALAQKVAIALSIRVMEWATGHAVPRLTLVSTCRMVATLVDSDQANSVGNEEASVHTAGDALASSPSSRNVVLIAGTVTWLAWVNHAAPDPTASATDLPAGVNVPCRTTR